MAKRFALDMGRYAYKGAVANHQTVTEIAGLAILSADRYEKALLRDGGALGIVRWGEKFFAVGEQANTYTKKQDATTATRYVRDNIGIVAASMVARMLASFTNGQREYEGDLIVSNPPKDVEFLADLKEAIIGDWFITAGGLNYDIRIDRVITLDEPIAILMNTLLNVDGVSYRNKPNGSIIVIDLGGVTADISVLGENGKLALGLIDSAGIGINDSVTGFGEAIKKRHSKYFKGVREIDPALLHRAYATGWFNGGKDLDCQEEAERFKTAYINELMQWLENAAKGLINYHTVLFGGGGSGLLERELLTAVDHDHIIFADDSAQIATAGARGMLKYAKVLEASGKI